MFPQFDKKKKKPYPTFPIIGANKWIASYQHVQISPQEIFVLLVMWELCVAFGGVTCLIGDYIMKSRSILVLWNRGMNDAAITPLRTDFHA